MKLRSTFALLLPLLLTSALISQASLANDIAGFSTFDAGTDLDEENVKVTIFGASAKALMEHYEVNTPSTIIDDKLDVGAVKCERTPIEKLVEVPRGLTKSERFGYKCTFEIDRKGLPVF